MNGDATAEVAELFGRLGIARGNVGACLGPDAWRGGGEAIVSVNPANGSELARVSRADATDLDAVLAAATSAARAWRDVPGPQTR